MISNVGSPENTLSDCSTPLRRQLLAWRVSALLNLVRRSATPAYRRVTGLSDFEWRVVRQVGVFAPLLLTELAALLGQDKSQVSRSMKRLTKAGTLSREGPRGRFVLTASGQAIYARILRLSRTRNSALIRELTDRELETFTAFVAHLQANARTLLDAEEDEDEGGTRSNSRRQTILAARLTDRPDVRRRQQDLAPRDRLILPDLINLLNLLRSSAVPVHGRETRLPELECRMVSEIGERGSLTLIELVPLMNRDKSQVGRGVKRLAAQGLVAAEKIGGGRHVVLALSQKGNRVYERLVQLSLEQNAVLTSGLRRPEQQTLQHVLDKLGAAAEVLLAREQARESGIPSTALPRSIPKRRGR